MLQTFVTRRRASTIEALGEHCGEPLRSRLRTHSYERLRLKPGLPGGAYLFTNVESLDPRMFNRACELADCLRAHDPDAIILNNPEGILRRYELCRTLFREGVNSFDCYRVDEGRTPARWPVFVRGEYDHYGAAPELIEDPDALATELARRHRRARDRTRRLIVEFVDTRMDGGVFRKYSVFRVGAELIAAHVYFGESWMVKMNRAPTPDELAEEEQFVATNPHAAEVLSIFERAGVDYGRIDYSVGPNGIEVWEINTNPTIINRHIRVMESRWHVVGPVVERVGEALLAIAQQGASKARVPLAALRPIHAKFFHPFIR